MRDMSRSVGPGQGWVVLHGCKLVGIGEKILQVPAPPGRVFALAMQTLRASFPTVCVLGTFSTGAMRLDLCSKTLVKRF